MELKQLEAFVYVVKLNSFSKAADTIFLSQPTISAHISSLEKELGTQLLIRSTKEVYPTKTGKEFFEYAHNILSLREHAIHSISGMGQDTKGDIAILSSSVPAQYLLPEVISDFHKLYPNIVIHVHQSDSGSIGDALCGCYYDFGVVGTKLSTNKFIQKPFYNDTLVIAYPSDLEMDEEFTRNNLAAFIKNQPFIMREAGSGTLLEFERYLAKLKLSLPDLKPVCFFGNTQGVIHAVANGTGISFVSKAAAALYIQAGMVKIIEIDSSSFSRSFYLLLKKEMVISPRQNIFMQFLMNYYNSKA